MADGIKDNVHSALFRREKGSIFSNGEYTFRQTSVFGDELEGSDVTDKDRLKDRLLRKIIELNSMRGATYPKAPVYPISHSTPFVLRKFKINSDSDPTNTGKYTLYPLEFICNGCGHYYSPKKSELTSMSNSCHCGRELKQNSIVLYCEDCGQFSEMSPYCPDHGIDSMYIIRGKMDNIATWKKLCKQCNNGGKGPETIFFKCKICGNVAKPLTVRDGGVISPVVLTFVDLEKLSTPERDKNEILRIIIKDEYITNNSLSKYIDVGNRSVQENIELLLAAEKNPFISVTEDVKVAVDYVKEVVEKVEESFKGIDIESINDIRSIIVNSKSYSDYILDSDVDIDYYYNCYEDICRKYSLKDIRYIPDLRLIQSCIGMINGINKFYESGFVPHFEPFKVRMSDPDIYSMVNPIITEGILFSLDPVRLCRWLFENNIVDCNYSSVEDCEKFILHMASDSSEYHAVKVVLHTFSHLLIKQSSLHTGLAEGTCSELLFINNGAFLIYSTSSVNIGGFDYAFKYSIPDWFREMNIAAEDCTFDPYCSEDGGRCFSCVFVQEHVCSEFNRDLSRLSLIGGGEYLVGLWNNED